MFRTNERTNERQPAHKTLHLGSSSSSPAVFSVILPLAILLRPIRRPTSRINAAKILVDSEFASRLSSLSSSPRRRLNSWPVASRQPPYDRIGVAIPTINFIHQPDRFIRAGY